MFNIEISDTTRFTVKFSVKDETGAERVHSFALIADRLPADEFKERFESMNYVYADFMASVVTGWENVRDGNGTPVEFSEEALRKVCKIAGMANLMFKVYSAEVVVKEKN